MKKKELPAITRPKTTNPKIPFRCLNTSKRGTVPREKGRGNDFAIKRDGKRDGRIARDAGTCNRRPFLLRWCILMRFLTVLQDKLPGTLCVKDERKKGTNREIWQVAAKMREIRDRVVVVNPPKNEVGQKKTRMRRGTTGITISATISRVKCAKRRGRGNLEKKWRTRDHRAGSLERIRPK